MERFDELIHFLSNGKERMLLSSRPSPPGKRRESTLCAARDIHRVILEELQGIIMLLEDQLRPLILAEQSVLVDVLYKPELLFPPGAEAKQKCENGGRSSHGLSVGRSIGR